MDIKTNVREVLAVLPVVFIFGILLLCIPFATLWSLNTVFGLGVAYTFKSWIATTFLLSTAALITSISRSSK